MVLLVAPVGQVLLRDRKRAQRVGARGRAEAVVRISEQGRHDGGARELLELGRGEDAAGRYDGRVQELLHLILLLLVELVLMIMMVVVVVVLIQIVALLAAPIVQVLTGVMLVAEQIALEASQ